MSIDTDPTIYDYSIAPNPICNLCYTPNKTPERLFLCFSGIQIGDLWIPGDPVPPNDCFFVDIIDACSWQTVHAGSTFNYAIIFNQSEIGARTPGNDPMFGQSDIQACQTWFANGLVNPAIEKYYGGYALVTHMMPDEQIAIPEIMALMNIKPEAETWARPFPSIGEFGVHRFSRREGATNILMKVDHP